MEQKIAKIIKETINKYLVTHTPIVGDTRCRLDVLAEEAAREILNEGSVAASSTTRIVYVHSALTKSEGSCGHFGLTPYGLRVADG